MIGRLGAALIMGAAINGMHYVDMAACRFGRKAYCIGSLPIDNQWLAVAVALITIALPAMTLVTTLFDAHLQSQTSAQARRLKKVQRGTTATSSEIMQQRRTTVANPWQHPSHDYATEYAGAPIRFSACSRE